jgi:hypothetical protein
VLVDISPTSTIKCCEFTSLLCYWIYSILEFFFSFIIFQFVYINLQNVSKQTSARRRLPRPNTTPSPSRSLSRNMDTNSLIGQTMRVQHWLNEKTVKTLQVKTIQTLLLFGFFFLWTEFYMQFALKWILFVWFVMLNNMVFHTFKIWLPVYRAIISKDKLTVSC